MIMRDIRRFRLSLGFAAVLLSGLAWSAVEPDYMNYAALTKAVQDLAASNPKCTVDVIGASRQGRGIHILTLAGDAATADSKPALLITAGLDGRHRLGTETAIRVARRLLSDHADVLNDTTVYVIPCLNPDGLERNAGPVNYGHAGTLRVVDEDRDGAVDEDGPADLNGDGMISLMRRLNPPLDDVATHMADPVEPRLLKTPEPSKGERAVYSVYVEGLDADSDGRIAEDGPGAVDLERNFIHRWPEHEISAGPTQISEPESAALAQFVLSHRNIVLALNYGRHDNLINVPDGKGNDLSGQAPKDLDSGDVDWYKELSKVYKNLTDQQRAPSEDTAGALHSWLYAQRGIPSFATVIWGRPDASKVEKPATQPTAPPAESQPATSPETTASKPESPEKKKDKDELKPADPEAAAWLEYSDRDRNHEGFIEWKPFKHPTLGDVEIGGFVPGFQMNPPSEKLDGLAEKQTAFAVELIKRRPKLVVQGPTVKKLASNVYEVRFGIVNEGYLPTATAIARKARSIMPTIVRISAPIDQIIAGDRVTKTWGIGGSGERLSLRWIVRMDDGGSGSIELINPQLGNQTITFKSEETAATQPEPIQ